MRRIRASMYLAFLVLALAVMVQATQTLGLEEVRMTDAELLDRAGEQRTLAEQLGRRASLLVHEVLQAPEPVHAEQLSMQLRHYASRALQLRRQHIIALINAACAWTCESDKRRSRKKKSDRRAPAARRA